MSIPQKLFIDWLFQRKSVSRNVRINTISLVFRSRFHRQNVTPFGPPLQAKFWMILQAPDRGCLYADVRKTDFRFKWPSKNNFTELDISQSLGWQCPSLSRYFLLVSFRRISLPWRRGKQKSHNAIRCCIPVILSGKWLGTKNRSPYNFTQTCLYWIQIRDLQFMNFIWSILCCFLI